MGKSKPKALFSRPFISLHFLNPLHPAAYHKYAERYQCEEIHVIQVSADESIEVCRKSCSSKRPSVIKDYH